MIGKAALSSVPRLDRRGDADPCWPTRPHALVAALSTLSRHIHDSCEWTSSVDAMLAAVGEATRTSRVWIFQTLDVSDTDIVQDYIFEWAAAPEYKQLHLNRFRLFRTPLATPEYRALVKDRTQGQHSALLTSDLPHGALRDDLEGQRITAMVTVPIMVDGAWWGTLGLDDCVRLARWSVEEIEFLRTAADLIAAVVYRQRLADRTRQLAILDQTADSGVWDWASDPGRLWCSDAFYRLLGYPPPFPRLPLRPLLHHLPRSDRDSLMDRVRRCMAGTSDGFRLDVQIRTRTGAPVWCEVRADVRRDAAGRPQNISGLVLEIGSRKRVEATLRDAADTDPLTGALNRRGFETLGERLMTASTRADEALHLLVLDIDHFKQVNDTYGHAVGDVALTCVAACVREHLRDGDLLARIGGEEFAILLRAEPNTARAIAERMRKEIAAAPVDAGAVGGPREGLRLTASLGVATLVPGEPISGTLRRADAALYAAKRAGRDRVVEAETMAHVGAA